jgi:hypothetical protein
LAAKKHGGPFARLPWTQHAQNLCGSINNFAYNLEDMAATGFLARALLLGLILDHITGSDGRIAR